MDSALSIEHLEHWEGWSIGRGGTLGRVEHWEGGILGGVEHGEGWSVESFYFSDHQFHEGGRDGALGRVEFWVILF